MKVIRQNYRVGSKDHGSLCRTLVVGRRHKGAASEFASGLVTALMNGCWLHGCALPVGVQPAVYLRSVYFAVCVLYFNKKFT